MKHLKQLHNNQKGLVAITVTIFFMIVLSLVVLAFSQAARREQRQTLDRQLSSQAYYSAESGINDAIKWVHSNPGQNIDTCTNPTATQQLDNDGIFSYACVLVNQKPNEVVYGAVDTQEGEIVSLSTPPGQTLNSLKFEWKTKGAGNDYSGCTSMADMHKFPPSGNSYNVVAPGSCDAGMLRVYLMRKSTASESRDALASQTFHAFLRPVNNPGALPSVAYSVYPNSDQQGQVVAASCTTVANKCSATIDNLPSGSDWYLHIRSIYSVNEVIIRPNTGVQFDDAQAIIDSTGRANDVLRRLQVRIPIHPELVRPSFMINGPVCKRLGGYPGVTSSDNDCLGSNYFQ